MKLMHFFQKYLPVDDSPPMDVMSKSSFDSSQILSHSVKLDGLFAFFFAKCPITYPSKPKLAFLLPSSSAVVHVGPVQGLKSLLVPSQ